MWKRSCVCMWKEWKNVKTMSWEHFIVFVCTKKSSFHISPTKQINDRKSMSMERKRVDENPFKCGPSTSSSFFASYSPSAAMQNSIFFSKITKWNERICRSWREKCKKYFKARSVRKKFYIFFSMAKVSWRRRVDFSSGKIACSSFVGFLDLKKKHVHKSVLYSSMLICVG